MDKIISLNKPNSEQRKQIIEKTFEQFIGFLEKNNLPTPNYDELRMLYFQLAFNNFQQAMQAQHNADMAKLQANKDVFLKLLDAQAKAKESTEKQAPKPPLEVIEGNGSATPEEPKKETETPAS